MLIKLVIFNFFAHFRVVPFRFALSWYFSVFPFKFALSWHFSVFPFKFALSWHFSVFPFKFALSWHFNEMLIKLVIFNFFALYLLYLHFTGYICIFYFLVLITSLSLADSEAPASTRTFVTSVFPWGADRCRGVLP
jgi:hypothetical protein